MTNTVKLEVEQFVIAGILNRNSNYDAVAGFLRPEHFSETHESIFSAMKDALDDGKTVDALLLRQKFGHEIFSYAMKIQTAALGASILDHALMLVRLWKKEQLATMAEKITTDIHDEIPVDDIIDMVTTTFDSMQDDEVNKTTSTNESLDEVAKQIDAAYRNKGKVNGITTGITELDRKIGGLRGDELTVLAGRSAMGKTSFALNMANAALRQHKRVVMFSLEMSKEQLLQKLICMKAGVESERVRNGDITVTQAQELFEAKDMLKNEVAPLLTIFDRPAIKVSAIRSICRVLKRKKKLDIIFIDHLNLISPDNPKATTVEGLTQITGALKALTKELKIPVVLLCQLNRAVESQEDKRPSLKDLRGSGSIEQDAEQVIFLYRPEYYLAKAKPEEETGQKADKWREDMERAKNKCFLIVDKNRNGSVGSVEIYMDVAINRVGNLEHREIYGGRYD